MSASKDEPPAQQGTNPHLFQANECAVTQIMSMGFSRNAATRALFYTGNQSVDQAADWLLENIHSNLDTPLQVSDLPMADSSGEDDDDDFVSTDSFKMVFVVNNELNMGVGKIAAQVAHAALSLFRNMMEDDLKAEILLAWGQLGETKIVLKGDNTSQLEALYAQAGDLHLDSYIVHDAGHTQVAAGSSTVLGIFGKVDVVNKVTGKLQLL